MLCRYPAVSVASPHFLQKKIASKKHKTYDGAVRLYNVETNTDEHYFLYLFLHHVGNVHTKYTLLQLQVVNGYAVKHARIDAFCVTDDGIDNCATFHPLLLKRFDKADRDYEHGVVTKTKEVKDNSWTIFE